MVNISSIELREVRHAAPDMRMSGRVPVFGTVAGCVQVGGAVRAPRPLQHGRAAGVYTMKITCHIKVASILKLYSRIGGVVPPHGR